MATRTGTAGDAAGRAAQGPFRLTWQLLTNVKFALFLVGLAAALSMIGVAVPQLPEEMRGNPAAESAWLETQRETFGVLTDPMNRLDMFTVFRSWWFNGLWVLIIVSVTVCTVSRIRPTARSVHRPQREVPNAYFERAHHRAEFSHEGGVDAVEDLLRRRRYNVERVKEEGGATYLFAERYAWSQYGTFISHLALLMLLVGGFLTVFVGFQRVLPLSEERSAAPVFDEPGSGQIFVEMLDAHRGMDEGGNIVAFESTVELRQGEEVVTCEITPNEPCSAFGHTFYQATYFDDLVTLRVESPDGQLLFDDVVDFSSEVMPAPYVVVRDAAGDVVFEQKMPQLGSFADNDGRLVALSQFDFAGTGDGEVREVDVGWRNVGGEMELFVFDGTGDVVSLAEGTRHTLGGGHELHFMEVAAIPRIRLLDMPGAIGDDGAVLQLVGWTDGIPTQAWDHVTPDEEPMLVIHGVDDRPLVFEPGEERETSSGYRYTFGGQVAGAGIDVRRDPGDTFIWIAIGMAMVGLSITFYVPRRRLWARVSDGRTELAGVAERTTRFGRELRMMGAQLGARDALLPTDEEERY